MRRAQHSGFVIAAVVFAAASSVGCADSRTLIDQTGAGGSMDVATGTGGGSVAIGSVTCRVTTPPAGTSCKLCFDSAGAVVSDDCSRRGGTGTGGAGTGPGGSEGGGSAGSGGGACIDIDDGGPTSCKDQATWKKYGIERCAQQGLVLTDITFGPACGASYFERATYTCCAGTNGGTGTGGASGAPPP